MDFSRSASSPERIMKSALLRVLLSVIMALVAHRAAAQVADTTSSRAEPEPGMLAPDMIDAGRKIFHGKGTCSGCHGDKLQGGPVAPALTGASWRHITGTYQAIIDRIDNGLQGTLMVSHPGGINESQVQQVASYVYAVSHQKAKP
jgi:mono/diheme cytochrome c family protein